MSTIGTSVLTLADHAKRLDPNGTVPVVVELLSQTNEILDDMLWKEGNLPVGERVTVRTGLPTVAWRLLNQGVATSKSTTAQITEQTGMLEAWSEIDKDLCELNGNTPQFRLSESKAFIEAMNQEFAQTLFYGNQGVSPEEFTGMSIRYSSTTAGNGQNLILGGGSDVADSASIWLICWGENTVYGVFPKGSKAGIMHENLGLVTVQGSTGIGGTRLRAYQDHWQWKCGIVVKDWRYAVRVANIDVSALVAQSSDADLLLLMTKMMHRIPTMSMGRPVFYANRTVKQWLDIQAANKTNVHLLAGQEEGKLKTTFRGIPIRTCDGLLDTEALAA